MAIEDQSDEMFAGNYHVMRWAELTEEDGTTPFDLTGKIVKFALSRYKSAGVPRLTPLLDHRTDTSAQLSIVDAAAGHVEMELLPADTATLAPKGEPGDFYWELEVYTGANTLPVVVATGTLTVKPNVDNA